MSTVHYPTISEMALTLHTTNAKIVEAVSKRAGIYLKNGRIHHVPSILYHSNIHAEVYFGLKEVNHG